MEDGKYRDEVYTIFYKDVDKYEDLPEVSKSRGTERIFKRFKEKQKEEIISNRIIADLNRIHKRNKL